MDRTDVLDRLRRFIVDDVLDGRDIQLADDTPLLEWGIINSLEMVRLLAFMREDLGVEVPVGRAVADNFRNLDALADLVVSIDAARITSA